MNDLTLKTGFKIAPFFTEEMKVTGEGRRMRDLA
jgi:hypothetical protein